MSAAASRLPWRLPLRALPARALALAALRARTFAALALTALPVVVAACASEPPRTVPETDPVRQLTLPMGFSDRLPTDLLLVVDGSTQPASVELRAVLAKRVAATVAELARGSGRRNPVDVRAAIVIVGHERALGPRDDARLAWKEDHVTAAGAARFADALRDGLARPATRPDATNVLAALDLARAALTPRSYSHVEDVIEVVATARDDPGAVPPSRDPRAPDDFHRVQELQVPATDASCTDPDWRLVAWANATFARVVCRDDEPFRVDSAPESMRCIPRAVERTSDGTPRCRVQARRRARAPPFPPASGLGPCSPPSPNDPDPPQEVCEVHALTGEDARRCADRNDTCEGCASGWCLVPVPDFRAWCRDLVRFVGDAAPALTSLDVACDVTD